MIERGFSGNGVRWKMGIQVIGAFLAVAGFGMIIEVPRKLLYHTAFAGAVGWLVYLAVMDTGCTSYIACFWASVAVSIFSHIQARRLKAPVTVFLIGGILPMVPGAGMYRTAYSIMVEDAELVYMHLQETLLIAGAIAVAIFITDSVARIVLRRKG